MFTPEQSLQQKVAREKRFLKRQFNRELSESQADPLNSSSSISELESDLQDLNINRNMADQGIDQILQGLSEEDRNQIQQHLATQIGAANKVLKVTNLNTCIELPKYDSQKMTSGTFFKKCRDYFTAQGYEANLFHTLLPIILKGEYKLWYDSV
jgi:hypothetical protein